jgi:beta-glucosidase
MGLLMEWNTESAAQEPYRDPHRPVEERVKDLLGRLTLEEKVSQMRQVSLNDLEMKDGQVTTESLERLFGQVSVGTIESPLGRPVEEVALQVQAAQEYLRTRTRLSIPAIPIQECLHGPLAHGATIFPQALAQGATWNPELIHAMATAIAREASAMGVAQALSPLFDLARDPRYGRVEECFGECPYLVSRLGVAFVTGLQGPDSRPGIASDRIMATAKHFAGYSVPQGGLNLGPSSLGEREMRSLHLVPFEAAVKEAHICSVMPSYNEVDGVPAHANRWLLTQVLRGEWGFMGYTFADYGAVNMLAHFHRVAEDQAEAGRLALEAGLDLEAPSLWGFAALPDLVRRGVVREEQIDQAAACILRAKFLAGLFDRPRGVPPEQLRERVHTPEHVALARRIAEESVILLQNEGNLLPLDPARVKSLAVIGPNADQVQFGDYSPSKSNADGVTVLQGLKNRVGNQVEIHYAKGCTLVGRSTEGFGEAVEAAQRSDVAIVVIGDTSMILSGVGWGDPTLPASGTVGEGYDVTDPVPPGVQQELVQAIHATGKPVIVVLLHGRPYSIPWMKEHVPAILDAFYPGEQQGNAIADLLFGQVNPSGRLPVSIPQSAGHIPTVYDYKPSGRGYYHQPGRPEKLGRDYVFSSPDPLWPFGFGLSYTTFDYSDLQVDTPTVAPDGTVKFRFTLTNTGDRPGQEVAQVYFRDLVSSTTTPEMRLLRFRKVELQPGESRTLEFAFPAGELALWNRKMQRVVEPGGFDLLIGASAEDVRLRGSFVVADEIPRIEPKSAD